MALKLTESVQQKHLGNWTVKVVPISWGCKLLAGLTDMLQSFSQSVLLFFFGASALHIPAAAVGAAGQVRWGELHNFSPFSSDKTSADLT